MLVALQKWNAEIGKSGAAVNTAERDLDSYQKKVATLSVEIDKNAKAFKENLEAIEKHRKGSIAASEESLAATIKTTQDEIRVLNESFAARTISQSDCNRNINKLFADQALAKQAAYDAERAINEKAKNDSDELVAKDAEAKTKLQENLDALNVSVGEAKKIRDGLLESQRGNVAALQDQQREEIATKGAVDSHAGSQRVLAKDVTAASDGVSALAIQLGVATANVAPLSSSIAGLTSNMNALAAASARAAAAVASVTDGT